MAAICSLRIVCAARAPRVAAADSSETVPEPPKAAASPIKAPEAPKLRAGQKYKNLAEAVDAGLLQGCAPFPKGIDALGFFKNIDQAEAQRYADVEITHGRVAMLAALGFYVGEQVEGSAFLFDASVTGPAINHFQQVPPFFAVSLGIGIVLSETIRVNMAWQSPFEASRLFLQKDDHVPGDYAWDPLNLSNGKSANDMKDVKMKELNNGRLAMVAIAGLVAQELVDGVNVFQPGSQ